MANVSNANSAPQTLMQGLGTISPGGAERTEAAAPPDLAKSSGRVAEAVAPTREAVQEAAKRIEEFVQSVGRSLSFTVDSSTGRSILRVVDPQSGEVVRQLPPEEVLRVARAVEFMQGVLVNQRA